MQPVFFFLLLELTVPCYVVIIVCYALCAAETFWFTYFLFFLPFAASTDSPAATLDSETITLNSGTLQTFEILPVSDRELIFVTVFFLLNTATS